ncbi:MAG: hypothetical protein [Circular genetic element sp.]|nr:MAG: hypothetical protein [Circular genetic element sp.]
MPRSKELHVVTKTISIEQPEAPAHSGSWAAGLIQVDELLSQKLGLTVRNGNSFRLVGYGAQLKGGGHAEQDIGFAGATTLSFVPVTRHSVAAHQNLYKQFMRQKKLSNRIGKLVRYDDFELGWDSTYRLTADRKSVIRYSGIGDPAEEECLIFGNAIAGDTITIQDIYNSLNPVEAASTDAFGVVIKEPKYTFKFPSHQNLMMSTSFSAAVEADFVPDAYSSQIATGHVEWLPSDNHLSHLTGTLKYDFRGVAQDTPSQAADTLDLVITLVYEGWGPLDTKPRTKTSKK